MTRDEILEAAAQIFRQKGYHAASMADIAQAVNLQKASLYHHVSSKQEILLALLDRALDILIARLEKVLAESQSPAEKLRQAVRSYVEILVEHRDLATVLLIEFRALEESLRQQHVPRRDAFEALWRDLILEGIQVGDFATTDPSLAVKGMLGMLNWLVIWYRPDGPRSPQQIADCFADLLLDGLLRQGDGV